MIKPFTLPDKAIIGMVHVPALPGTPSNILSVSEIIDIAVREAGMIEDAGFDAIMLENMHDIPYLNRDVGPEITATMTAIACEVRRNTTLPIGIQILAGAGKESLAVAHAAELNFIRVEGFVFSHVADEGIMNACAGELLRYRKTIDAEDILVFADIKKKHSSHALTADVDIAQTAMAAEFFLADGVIVTGGSTGESADIDELRSVMKAVNIPVMIGSGITADNLKDYWRHADAFIIGSWLKEDGFWKNPLNEDRLRRIIRERGNLS